MRMSCWLFHRGSRRVQSGPVSAPSVRALVIAGLCLVACVAPVLHANGGSVITEVPRAYKETARLYGIPPKLFYALALQESGRTVDGAFAPWPWTLNVEGQGYYYNSQTEVWDALNEFVIADRTNIGIGLLQVTYPYNQHVLSELYLAIDPHTNLRMGAVILLERYRESGDWWIAVGHYHSPGKKPAQVERAQRYRESVKRRWKQLYGPYAGELE